MFSYLKEAFVQVKNGAHWRRREEIIRNLSSLPAGKNLLQYAEEKNIPIRVVGELGNFQGLFGKRGKDDDLAVYVLNTGNPARMTLTLAHELHHARQFSEMGIKDPLAPLSSAHSRSLHIQKLMIEADAFTTETMLALKFLRAGSAAYMKDILESGSQPYTTIQDFLLAHPCEKSQDEAAYRRALFTEIMLKGLDHYSKAYFGHLGTAVKNSSLAAGRDEHDGSSRRVTEFPLPDGIVGAYGDIAATRTSARALSAAFLQAAPYWERKTLRLVEQLTVRAKTMTEKEFQAARDEIVRRCEEYCLNDDLRLFPFASRRREQAHRRLRRGTPE